MGSKGTQINTHASPIIVILIFDLSQIKNYEKCHIEKVLKVSDQYFKSVLSFKLLSLLFLTLQQGVNYKYI